MMENKGQISAEYLLLMLVILIIMAAVTVPLVGNSISSSMDISHVSDAEKAVSSIADAVDLVYANGPGAKRTLNLYIPQTTSLQATNTTIGMIITTNSNATYNSAHVQTINATTGTQYVFAQISYPTTTINATNIQGWRKFVVEWPRTSNLNQPITVTVS